MPEGGKPIETLYRGYRFRSRLEARWAIFFDRARIPWRYEPEGYDLSGVELPSALPERTCTWLSSQLIYRYKRWRSGDVEYVEDALHALLPLIWIDPVEERAAPGSPIWYLPDFYLPEQDCWVEIKGTEPSTLEKRIMQRLVWSTGKNGYIFWGDVRPPQRTAEEQGTRRQRPAERDRVLAD